MGFLTLFGAILSEVFGSSMMKVTAVTNSRLPVVGIILGYGMAFYLLSLALMTIPLSFAYAAWSGVGTALTALIGFGVAAPKNGGRHHRTDHRSCAHEDIKEKWIMKKYIFLGSAIVFE